MNLRFTDKISILLWKKCCNFDSHIVDFVGISDFLENKQRKWWFNTMKCTSNRTNETTVVSHYLTIWCLPIYYGCFFWLLLFFILGWKIFHIIGFRFQKNNMKKVSKKIFLVSSWVFIEISESNWLNFTDFWWNCGIPIENHEKLTQNNWNSKKFKGIIRIQTTFWWLTTSKLHFVQLNRKNVFYK